MPVKLILFVIFSIPLVMVSLRTLSSAKTHGFYRFFAWECILWLALSNYSFWLRNPFSINQILSWILLLYSLILLILGLKHLVKLGKPNDSRKEKALFNMEKTTLLVNTGIYKFIRHPIYGSLIFLTWGILFKNIDYILIGISVVSTVLLYITAKYDEKECIIYFGDEYIKYKTQSKMFIPFIL